MKLIIITVLVFSLGMQESPNKIQLSDILKAAFLVNGKIENGYVKGAGELLYVPSAGLNLIHTDSIVFSKFKSYDTNDKLQYYLKQNQGDHFLVKVSLDSAQSEKLFFTVGLCKVNYKSFNQKIQVCGLVTSTSVCMAYNSLSQKWESINDNRKQEFPLNR